jgi:hypothetical protein
MQTEIQTAPSMNPIVPKIIWSSLVASQLLIYYMAMRLPESGRLPDPGFTNNQMVFAALAVINGCIGFFLIPKLFANGLRKKLGTSKPMLAQIFLIMIVQWALFESVTLLGFVLANQAVSPQPMVPFLVAGLLGDILTFPSQSRIDKQIAAIALSPKTTYS